MSIRSVGLCLKPDSPQAADAVRDLAKWLADRGVEVLLDPDAARWLGLEGRPRGELAGRVDLIVVLGGDGTLLAVAREVGPRATPVLGINLGTFGFLTEVTPAEQYAALDLVLRGEMQIQLRMRLDVRADRDDAELGRFLALNDAVIMKSALSRILTLEARTDDGPVTTYRADGLIVATPTGSTAYNLSAGGPIILPGLDAIVLAPVCPHALTQRPVVLPASAQIEIRVWPQRSGEVQLTVDGQEGLELGSGDRVRITRSPHPLHLVASPFRTRFEILREKLRWGEA
jgi:NAD+ kinase